MGWFFSKLFGIGKSAADADPSDHAARIAAARALAARLPNDGLVTVLTVKSGATLRLTVYNPSAEPHQFCRYHTPFEGIRNDWLEVTDSAGTNYEYRGVMAKRVPPGEDDFITLEAGAEQSADFDPREPFGLSKGRYMITFKGGGVSRLPDSAPIAVDIPEP